MGCPWTHCVPRDTFACDVDAYLNADAAPSVILRLLMTVRVHRTHILPKYDFWVWGTLTGVTGVFLFIQTVVIFVFSLPLVRRRLSRAFWITHKSYPLFYAFNLLHGSARLVQVTRKSHKSEQRHVSCRRRKWELIFKRNRITALFRRISTPNEFEYLMFCLLIILFVGYE